MFCAVILFYLNIHFYKIKKEKAGDCLESYLQGTAVWMLTAFFMTEILSLFHGISRVSLIAAWGSIDVLLLAVFLLGIGKSGNKLWQLYFPVNKIRFNKQKAVLFAIGIVVMLLALGTVPYNWDSMTYRLSRVAYWTQSGSVEHYATNCLRSIANPVLGEFVQLHIYVLTGRRDSALNLLQCFSYLTDAVIIYGIARKLKCNENFRCMAVLLFMSMPIAFAEALNTQVDLFSTLWLLSFVYLLMDFVYQEEKIICSSHTLFRVWIMGNCVAWGYLTKPSVCVAMAVFCLWLLICCLIRRDGIASLLPLAGTAGVGMMVPLAWETMRNLRTFHSVSAYVAGGRQLIGTLKPTYVLVNLLKNLFHNMPNVYLPQLNQYIKSVMWQLSARLGVDINDPAISEDGVMYNLFNAPNYEHDTAINPIIVWLTIICLMWAVLRSRRKDWRMLYKSYSLAAVVSFLIFCTVLRWENFVTRYMISYLALLCPMIAIQLQKLTEGSERGGIRSAVIGIIYCICLLDTVNMAISHRLMIYVNGAGERPYGYFVNRTVEYQPCMDICGYIRSHGYQYIGFYCGVDDYEYPYWSVLREDIVQLEHVNVQNESAVYVKKDYVPQCIIWIGSLPEDTFYWNGKSYPNIVEFAEGRYLLTTE